MGAGVGVGVGVLVGVGVMVGVREGGQGVTVSVAIGMTAGHGPPPEFAMLPAHKTANVIAAKITTPAARRAI